MSNTIRKTIEEIRRGRDLGVHLPELGRRMAESYYQVTLLNFAMKYTVAYEVFSEELPEEDIRQYITGVREETERNLLSRTENIVPERSVERLDEMRNEIIRRMEVLTAYTDMLGNYEYVLNRLELRYEPSNGPLEGAQEMAQALYHYIFETDDNVTINEKIKQVLGQLPVRMTKQKFYDLVRGSMSTYLGSDASSLELYDYMIRTGAMLYHPEGIKQYYPDIRETMEYLAGLDFEHLDQAGYEDARARIERTALQIEERVDVYSVLTEVLNDLYVLVLTAPVLEETAPSEQGGLEEKGAVRQEAKKIIQVTCDAFSGNYSSIEAYIDTISEPLHALEGRLEEWMEQNGKLEAAVEEARVYVEGANSQSEYAYLSPLYDSLRQCSLLCSGSLFVDLKAGETNGKIVGEELLQETADRLIQDFADAFAGESRMIRRAVMAETLSLLPVFFSGRQEVLAYLQHALESCSDLAEYNGSVGMLYTIMEHPYQ